MLEVSSSKPLASKSMRFAFWSSSSHQTCLVRVTSPMWFASYCIGARVLPCAHPKGSNCGFSLSSK
uniref:Putative ovule protein n=1 Tax=Solanum chacoense TaxID=4108 RepID=A0A0V0HKY3_SOLCH